MTWDDFGGTPINIAIENCSSIADLPPTKNRDVPRGVSLPEAESDGLPKW